MSAIRKLFRHPDPYDTENTNELFLAAMRENLIFQYENCPEYRMILDSLGFSPDMPVKYEDIANIPPLPTLFLKRHRLHSMPPGKCPVTATSSGTSGSFSEVSYDMQSLLCGFNMVLKVFGRHGILSPCPANYVILGYKPHRSNRTAAAKTAYGFTFCAPALSRTFALKYENGGYIPDPDGVINAIEKYSRSPFPTRFMGFPAYMFFTLRLMAERGIRVKLPERSMIMLGGGWKEFYREQPDKQFFYGLAGDILGIPESRIHESYGAAEHPILYCDCKAHKFHIPVYSRVIIRDVNTLKPLGFGETGLVNLLTPMIRATPVLSVITDDLGVLHEGGECSCGNKSTYLELIGRAGVKDIKTCAAGAERLLHEITR